MEGKKTSLQGHTWRLHLPHMAGRLLSDPRVLLSIPKARKILVEFHCAFDAKQRIKVLRLWDETTNSVKTQQNIVKANLCRQR